ncbi:flagellar hook-length control protein [Mycolicibacillus trivialis]
MTTMTKRDAADAALSVAEDIAAGRLDPADLEAEIADTCRELMGTVTGPDHPCWAVQLDVCRAVLAAGGLPVDELAEWLSVARSRVGGTDAPAPA